MRFKLNILILCLSETYWIKGCLIFFDIMFEWDLLNEGLPEWQLKKNYCWHAFRGLWTNLVFEPVWCSMVIDTIKLASVTLTLIQGHRGTRKGTFLCHLSRKVLNGFGWCVVFCWDSLVYWISYLLYQDWSVFKGICMSNLWIYIITFAWLAGYLSCMTKT